MSLLLGAGALDAARADLDAGRLSLLGLRDLDLEDAVLEVGRHLAGVDPVGQAERAREASEGPLDAVEALALRLVLGLALTRDGENAVLDLDLDVALLHP